MIFVSCVTNAVMQDRLLAVEVMIEENLFLDKSNVVDSGEFVVDFDFG